ncbi:hypothetical protein M422DRAFT_240015 [Sphaerobolus stellatus SS14]|nr:hypothetical protein M422DRAFT_240015 [Sphaerobolus stellatus SS14]
MECGTLAVAFVRHEVVLVQLACTYVTLPRCLEVIPYRSFGQKTFLASSLRTRIPTTDIITILPSMGSLCPITGMLELPEPSYSIYTERARAHQRRLSQVWNSMPISVSLH